MSNTFNRRPLSVNADVDVRYKYFNYTTFKGISDNKNFATADQETFEDAKNVYVNDENILCSRPSTKLYTRHGLSDILRIWSFAGVTVYLTSKNSEFLLNFIDNEDSMLTVEITTKDISLLLMDEKIFVFSSSSIHYYDIFDKKYFDAVEKNLIYTPTTTVMVNGVRNTNDGESPNELTSSYITHYFFDSKDDAGLDELVGTTITLTIDGNTYSVDFELNTQVVFVKRNALLFDDNFAYQYMLGADTDNYPLISVSENGQMIISTAKVTTVVNQTTGKTVPITEVEIRYTVDGFSYKKLPMLTDILGYPKISRDGSYVAAFTQDGLYFYSLTQSKLDDGSMGYKYSKWTNVLADLNWKYANTINFNNTSQYFRSLNYNYNKLVGCNGDFIDYTTFAFTANVETFTGIDDNMITPEKYRPQIEALPGSGVYDKLQEKLLVPFSYTSYGTAASPSMMTVVCKSGEFYETFQAAQIGFRVLILHQTYNIAEIYDNSGALVPYEGSSEIFVATSSTNDLVTLKLSTTPNSPTAADSELITVPSGTILIYTFFAHPKKFSCDVFTCIEKNKYERVGTANVRLDYGYDYDIPNESLFYTIDFYDLGGKLIQTLDEVIQVPPRYGNAPLSVNRDYKNSNKFVALETTVNNNLVNNLLHVSISSRNDRAAYGVTTPNIYMHSSSSITAVALLSTTRSSVTNDVMVDAMSYVTNLDVVVVGNTVYSSNLAYKINRTDIVDKHPLRNGVKIDDNGVYLCTQDLQAYLRIDTFKVNSSTRRYELDATEHVGTYDPATNNSSETTVFSKLSTSVLTTHCYYNGRKPVALLFPATPIDIYVDTVGFIVLCDNDHVYSSLSYGQLEFDVITEGEMKYIVPQYIASLTSQYFTNENKLYQSALPPDGTFKLYFPTNKTEVFEETISNIHVISKDELAVFFEDSIHYISNEQRYKTKFSLGCKQGSDILTTFDAKNVIFPSQRGLVAMSYQDFIASIEQSLTYLSDVILKRFLQFNTSAIKLYQYKFWIICYTLYDTVAYVLDVRNNSWWCMQYDKPIDQIITINNLPYILIDGQTYTLDYSNDNYKDDYSNNNIEWLIKSQKLHLNAMNYYKHIMNITMSAIDKTEDPSYSCNTKLTVANYRKIADVAEAEILDYEVDVIRTFVKRLNYAKVSEFQFTLQNDMDNAIAKPLSLNSISIKYNLTGVIR